MENCTHIAAVSALKLPEEQICVICAAHHGTWVHLRTCQTCGITLCCDSSPHKHATRHFHETGHPVMISAEPGEQWMWCYVDKLMAEYE